MIEGQPSPLSREDREDLAAAATGADRRNTPTAYLIGGGVVLVLGMIMLIAAGLSVSGSKAAWSVQTQKVNRIESLANQLQTLRTAASDSNNIQVHPQIGSMGSDIQNIASRSGVTVKVPRTDPKQSLTSTARIMLYSYESVSDESLEDLLEWVHNTTQEIPGMRVETLVIRLGATTSKTSNTEWKLNVTFARTEQTS